MSDEEKGPYERCANCGKYGYDRVGQPNCNGKFCRDCIRKSQECLDAYKKDPVAQKKEKSIRNAGIDRYEGKPGKNAEKCEDCGMLMSPVILRWHLANNHEFPKCHHLLGERLPIHPEIGP